MQNVWRFIIEMDLQYSGKHVDKLFTVKGRLGHRKVYDVWFFLVRYICPILLLVVVITGLVGFFGSF